MQSVPQLEVLFDCTAKGLGLPGPLARPYGGDLSLAGDCLVANFVESVDGVVASPDAAGESGAVVSGGSAADRFLMGLLRACADAVLIGAGTLRATRNDFWFPESIFPDAAALFAELRKALGLPERPTLYVVTGSGRVDRAHPALRAGGVLIEGRFQPREILAPMLGAGHRRILCEGGPGLFAELIAAGGGGGLLPARLPLPVGRLAGDPHQGLSR